jgi:hypothetical protein
MAKAPKTVHGVFMDARDTMSYRQLAAMFSREERLNNGRRD